MFKATEEEEDLSLESKLKELSLEKNQFAQTRDLTLLIKIIY